MALSDPRGPRRLSPAAPAHGGRAPDRAALGLGLIGDFARYRGKSRLDALDGIAAGGVDCPARAEASDARPTRPEWAGLATMQRP